MRKLLKDTDARRLGLVELLTKKNTWMTTLELSERLNCSQRVIKDDLAFLRNSRLGFSIKSSYEGSRIEYDPNRSINSYYQYVLGNTTIFQVLEAVFFNKGITPYDLQEDLFLSQSTYYRLIRTSNPVLRDNFGIELDANTATVTGDEAAIRYFYYTYFSEKYSSSEWCFRDIDEQALQNLLNFALNLIDTSLSYSNYSHIKLLVAVNLTRFYTHDWVNLKSEDTLLDKLWERIPEMTPPLYETLKKLNIHLTKEMILQVFGPFIHRDFTFSYEQLTELLTHNHSMTRSVNFLSTLLDELSLNYSIPILNKQEVLWFINNVAYNEGFVPHTAYIYFNPNADLMAEITKFNPHFINDLTLGIKAYRQLINKPLTKFTIEHLVYQVCVRWRNLIISLHNEWSKVQAILISEFSSGRTQLIQDVIQQSFGNMVILEIFNGSEVTPELIETMDKDLVITTIPLPHTSSLPIFCFNGNISSKNISKLQQFVEDVATQKNQKLIHEFSVADTQLESLS